MEVLRAKLAAMQKELDAKVSEQTVVKILAEAQRRLRVLPLLFHAAVVRRAHPRSSRADDVGLKNELDNLAKTIASVGGCTPSDPYACSRIVIRGYSSISQQSIPIVDWTCNDGSALSCYYDLSGAYSTIKFVNATKKVDATNRFGENIAIHGFTADFWKVLLKEKDCQAAALLFRFGAMIPYFMFATVCLKEPFFQLTDFVYAKSNETLVRRKSPFRPPMTLDTFLDFNYSILCEQSMGDIGWAHKVRPPSVLAPSLQILFPADVGVYLNQICES